MADLIPVAAGSRMGLVALAGIGRRGFRQLFCLPGLRLPRHMARDRNSCIASLLSPRPFSFVPDLHDARRYSLFAPASGPMALDFLAWGWQSLSFDDRCRNGAWWLHDFCRRDDKCFCAPRFDL